MIGTSSRLLAFCVIAGGLAAASLYCLALLSNGLVVLRALGLGRRHCADWSLAGYLATAFALGSGVLASVWLILASLGWLVAPVVFAVTLLSLGSGLVLLGPLRPEVRSRTRATARALWAEPWAWRAATLLTALTAGAFAVAAFHPPRGDSVAFYLPWPRIIAASGRVIPLPGYDGFSDIWTIAEIHLAAVMATLGDWGIKPLPYLHALAAAALLWGMGRDAGVGRRGCVIAVAMLFTSSAVGLLVWDGKTDLVALPIGLAAIHIATHLRAPVLRGAAAATGLLCGFAVAAKLSYIPALAAAVLFLALARPAAPGARRWAARHLAATAGLLLVVALAGLVALAPQVAKNWAMTGEPLAPLYYLSGQAPVTDQTWYTPATTARLLLTYPLALTFGSYWAQHGNLSLLLLAFLPLAFVHLRGSGRRLFVPTGAAAAALLAWIVTRPSVFAPRYILCILVIFFIPVAAAAAHASAAAPRAIRTLIAAAVVFVLATTAWSLRPQIRMAVAYAGTGDVESYNEDDTFRMARLLNGSARPGARIAMLNYYRYPLRADLLECTLGIGDERRITAANDPPMVGYFRQGAEYLVYDLSTHTGTMPLDFSGLPAWLRVEEIYRGPRLLVFRLSGTAEAPPREAACRRDGRAWVARPLAPAG